MRDVIDILHDGRIHVETFRSNDESEFRISCYLNDPITRKRWYVIASRHSGWEHVSVSSEMKTPDWDTMCLAKDVFFRKDECCVQYHPKEEDYVNMHEHTLHIWKKMGEEFEMPPSILVGFKGVSAEQAHAVTKAFIDSMDKDDLIRVAGNQGIKLNWKFRRKVR